MSKFKSYSPSHTRLQLKNLLEKLFYKEVSSIERKDLGEANSVYFFKLSDDSEYVIRVCPKKRGWNGFDQEAWAYEIVKSVSLPVPKVVKIDTSCNHFPEAYIISERIPGKSGAKIKFSENKKEKIYNQLGFYLNLIHKVKVQGFGTFEEKENGFVGKSKDLWKYIEGELENGWFVKYLNAHKVFQKDEYNFYKRVITDHKSVFNIPQASLVHGDFDIKNTVVFKGKVVAVTDFENCKAMDPIYDFAYINMWIDKGDRKLDYIKEGYENKALFGGDFELKLNVYGVFLSLGLLGYFAERGNVNGLIHVRKKLRVFIKNLSRNNF